MSVAIQHLSSVPLAPRELNPEIPAQLELICMKAMTPDLERRYASADAMIADLEDFRKNPNISLDFTMMDLRPEEPAEPTQPIRTYDRTLHPVQKNREREPERVRERRRDYDDYEPPRRGGGVGVKILVVVSIVLAVALAVVLFRMVSDSIKQQSQAPVTYPVPMVVGYTVDQAREMSGVKDVFTIKEMGSEFDDEHPAGVIIRQNSIEDRHVRDDNLVIEVWVSAGEETGEMPDVVNKTPAQANVILKDLKEKYNLEIFADEAEMEFNDEITEGFIIRSIPAEHEELKNGDVIRLIVSKGPEKRPVPVPDFKGKQIDEVLRSLRDTWHLTCLDSDVESVESEAEPNSVVWQSLEPNTTVTEWDTIKFKISKGITIKERSIDILIPQFTDRTTVLVEVYVGDEESPQFSERVAVSDGTVTTNPPLKGTGTQIVKVCFDGVLDQSMTQELQFD